MEEKRVLIKISDSEWEVMRVIWTLGQANAQQIIQILADSMDWKVATVKTLLGRLVKKKRFGLNKRERNLFIIQLFPRWKPFEVLLKISFHIFVQKESVRQLLIWLKKRH